MEGFSRVSRVCRGLGRFGGFPGFGGVYIEGFLRFIGVSGRRCSSTPSAPTPSPPWPLVRSTNQPERCLFGSRV